MKPTTQLCVAARNVGRPTDSIETSGTVQSCIKELVSWMLQTDLGKRIDVSFGRTLEECRLGLTKTGGKAESVLNEIDALFDAEQFDGDSGGTTAAPAETPIAPE